MERWERAELGDVDLEYAARGTGPPIVAVHNGAGVDWFTPLLDDPSLTDRFQVIAYHRAGYAGSGPPPEPLTFADEAARFQALARHLGIGQAHVIGHSSSGCMALQIALDAPDLVGSLVLLEPALVSRAPSSPLVIEAMERYRAGDTASAVDLFLQGTCGPDYRAALAAAIPDALDQAVADAATFFAQELPALRAWQFDVDAARRITQPALIVTGERSGPNHRERANLLLEWLPRSEVLVVPDAGHLLHLENHRAVVDGMIAFLDRNPIPAVA